MVVEPGSEWQVGWLQRAGVEALDHSHARVLAKPQIELAEGDVDRRDPGGPALQEAVGEAARRGADVKAVAPGDVDAERLEGVLELDAAARDIARPLVDDQRCVGLDELARPQRHGPIHTDPNLPRPHRAGRRGARRKHPPLCQNRIYPGLLHRQNGTTAPPNCPFIGVLGPPATVF